MKLHKVYGVWQVDVDTPQLGYLEKLALGVEIFQGEKEVIARNFILHHKHLTSMIIGIFVSLSIITSLCMNVPAHAWTSDWIIWEYPEDIEYRFTSYCSSNTVSAYNSSIADWESVQGDCDLEYYAYATELTLDAVNTNQENGMGYTANVLRFLQGRLVIGFKAQHVG